jgi:periplasmic protein TonB
MFEDSLVESRIGYVSSSNRWTALASISLQFAVAAVVIALPLLHPEALSFYPDTPKVVLPLSPKAPVTVVRVERASAASTGLAAPSVKGTTVMPSRIRGRDTPASEVPSLAPWGGGMGTHDGIFNGVMLSEAGHGPIVTQAPARAATGPLHISSGVSQGLLIAPILPVYPAIAKAAHVEGTVVVEAIISRTGTIESLHVVSGPVMLQRAAIDAIQAARYQPYRLNGRATAVQTTITMNFRIGS